ncbi:MAG: site-specific integrase [Planctomycetota bacterium]|jgi:site-specific recombinase XerD
MKPTDFARHLTEYLTSYLVSQKNVSRNTILSYRDTFKLLLRYCRQVKKIAVEKITMDLLSDALVVDFLGWLETDRDCSISTRNQRLATIHSFFRFVQSEEPAGIFHFQKVIAIPQKKVQKVAIGYLSPEAMKLLLQQPNRQTSRGRRDLTLLSVLYDTGARVQELIDLRPCDVLLEQPAVITLTGKGNKVRRVPILKNTAKLLKNYLANYGLDKPWKNQNPLFSNSRHVKLTREGVAYIVAKHAAAARKISSGIPEHVCPHMFRHSKAMHMLQAGVNLIYIRDFLGHVDTKTTETYAKADVEAKRAAIESVCTDLVTDALPDWSKDEPLLAWLSDLK